MKMGQDISRMTDEEHEPADEEIRPLLLFFLEE